MASLLVFWEAEKISKPNKKFRPEPKKRRVQSVQRVQSNFSEFMEDEQRENKNKSLA
jgi:hypothetical protein